MSIAAETKQQVAEIGEKYKYGFVTDIEMDMAPKGLSEDTVRFISAKKGEPEWMLEWRLGAFRRWLTMKEPNWARVHYPKIDYQNAYYYAAPKNTPLKQSLDEVDPKLLETYKKLGIPLHEQMALAGVAVAFVLWQSGAFTALRIAIGWLPRRQVATAELAADMLDPARPESEREFVAAMRARDPVFDAAYRRIKKGKHDSR